jgi:hypothetical protein
MTHFVHINLSVDMQNILLIDPLFLWFLMYFLYLRISILLDFVLN